MAAPHVLVLEPDRKAQADFKNALHELDVQADVSGSLREALERVRTAAYALVIADVDALREGVREVEWVDYLGQVFGEFRAPVQHVMDLPSTYRTHIFVSYNERENVADHAAVLSAGADAYVSEAAASNPAVLKSYLRKFLTRRATDLPHGVPRGGAPAVARTFPGRATPRRFVLPGKRGDAEPIVPTPKAAPAELPQRDGIAAVFHLPDAALRNESGRLDAKRIAALMGVDLTQLVAALDARYPAVAKTPDSESLQERLSSFANTLAVLLDAFSSDEGAMRKWLNSPNELLGGKRPVEVALQPGGIRGVEQLVSGAWLGELG